MVNFYKVTFATTYKRILGRAIGIQKENWGNQAFFRDHLASIWKKCHTLIVIHFNAFCNYYY